MMVWVRTLTHIPEMWELANPMEFEAEKEGEVLWELEHGKMAEENPAVLIAFSTCSSDVQLSPNSSSDSSNIPDSWASVSASEIAGCRSASRSRKSWTFFSGVWSMI